MLDVLVVLSLLAASDRAEAKVAVKGSLGAPRDTPHPWAQFKVGTWVKQKTISVIRTGGETRRDESEMLETLVSLDAKKAVVEMTQKGAGMNQTTKVELPLKPDPKDVELAKQAPKPSRTGSETLTVAGRTFACTWSETILGDAKQGRSTMRTWESDDMPGRIVKVVSESDIAPGLSQTMTTDVVAFVVK
jgi:hypothetical protein